MRTPGSKASSSGFTTFCSAIAAASATNTHAASFGYGDMNIRSWNALFAPKGTPVSIVGRLNDALRAAVADAELRRRMQAVGVDLPAPDHLTPRAVTELIALGLERDVPALRARGEYLD